MDELGDLTRAKGVEVGDRKEFDQLDAKCHVAISFDRYFRCFRVLVVCSYLILDGLSEERRAGRIHTDRGGVDLRSELEVSDVTNDLRCCCAVDQHEFQFITILNRTTGQQD